MTKIVLGVAIGLSIGAGCRYLEIPLPAPPKLIGALLVAAMTIGYLGADRFLSRRLVSSYNFAPAEPSNLGRRTSAGNGSPTSDLQHEGVTNHE